jgi:endonuclease YncB( thermonuclease family)
VIPHGNRIARSATALLITSLFAGCAASATATTTTGPFEGTATTIATTEAGPTTATNTTPPRSTVPTVVPEGEVATVVSVTDGDTIRVDYEGGSNEAVRLIGINTPEKGECFAAEATAALNALLGGVSVIMTTDISDRDQYGRLLRYIYLPDGTFVNGVMVRQGYALARDYPPDSSQSEILGQAQAEAVSDELGMWAPDACGPAETTSGLVIADVEADAPGDDNTNLNGEWVDISNQGSTTAGLTGWVLKDDSSSHRYRFPEGFTLAPGSTVRVYSGCGNDSAAELYWCNRDSAVWNNSGDTAFLLDPSGNIHDMYQD